MKYSECGKESVRHQFDAFCKKALKWESRDIDRQKFWRDQSEVSIYELTYERNGWLSSVEEYPSDSSHFVVQGFDISIKNDQLAEALKTLSTDRREIVLLAYFLDMTDPEIAELLHIVRQTVQYRRVKSLKDLRKRMEASHEEHE